MESILKPFDLLEVQAGAGTGSWLPCSGPLLSAVSPIDGRFIGGASRFRRLEGLHAAPDQRCQLVQRAAADSGNLPHALLKLDSFLFD